MIISRKRFEAEIARRVEEESRRIWDNERFNRLAERMDKLESQLAEIKFRICDAEIDNHLAKKRALRMEDGGKNRADKANVPGC